MPIGNLTSQFFANLYLDSLDHFCEEVLRAKGYLRYVDDFALFHDDRGWLEELVPAHCALPRRPPPAPAPGEDPRGRDPRAGPLSRLWLLPGGYQRLAEENVRRFRNRLRGLRD